MFLIYGSLPGTKSSRYPTSPTVPGEQFQAPLQLGTCGRLGGTPAPQGLQGIPVPGQLYMVLFTGAPGDSTPNANPWPLGSHIRESYPLAGRKRN